MKVRSVARFGSKRTAGYMSGYLKNQYFAGRYSASHSWVYAGYVADWRSFCRDYLPDFDGLLKAWDHNILDHCFTQTHLDSG